MSHHSVTKNINRINNKLKKNKYVLQLNNKNSFYLFPFKPILGVVNQSQLGINEEINIYDQSTYSRVFTGLANLTARWRDSWEVVKKNDDDLFLTKSYKVGISYKAFITQVIKGVSFEPSPIDSNFISQVTDETITCYTYDEIPDENIQDFYVVPQLKNNKWMYISSVIEHKNSGVPIFQITLQSVNNLLASSGRAIEEFIQYGSAGEGYPFPLIDDDGNITVDPTRAKDLYIQNIQIENNGACALATIEVWGRPTEADTEGGSIRPKFNPKIEAPRRLLPYLFETPIASPINTKPNSETNYYYGIWQPKFFDAYETWKQQWINNFSPVDRTQYEGILSHPSRAEIEETNPINVVDGAHQFSIWDRTWKIKLNNVTFNTSADNMSPDSITLNGEYTLPQLLTFNLFITSAIETLPLSIEQLVSWNLRDLPIIGGFLNKLTFGIPIGWRELNVRIPAPNIPLLIPTQVVKYGNVMREQSSEKKDVFIPLEIFEGTLQSDATSFSGINTLSTIFKVQLTDRFSKVINNVTYNFNTKDLGQDMPSKDDDGTTINFGGNKPTKLVIDESIKPIPRKVIGFVTDYAGWKGLSKMPYRMTFFTAGNLQTWHGTYKSNAQLTNALRDWTNFMKLSDWSTTDNKYIDYPKDIVEPKPPQPNIPNVNLKTYLKYPFLVHANFSGDEDQRLSSFTRWFKSTERDLPFLNSYNDITLRWQNKSDQRSEYDLNLIGGVLGLQRNYEYFNVTFSVQNDTSDYFPDKDYKEFSIQIKVSDLITSGVINYDLKKDGWFKGGSPFTYNNFVVIDDGKYVPVYQCKGDTPFRDCRIAYSNRNPALFYSESRNSLFKIEIIGQKLKFGWVNDIVGYIPNIVNKTSDGKPASDDDYIWFLGDGGGGITAQLRTAISKLNIVNFGRYPQLVQLSFIEGITIQRKEVT